jgi:MFS family permease
VLPPVLMSNPGFVDEMGIDGLGAGKSRALEPNYLVAWSSEYFSQLHPRNPLITGAYNASYIISLMSAWWLVERFGNKNTLYASQATLAVACTVEVLSKNWTSWLASRICYVRTSICSAGFRRLMIQGIAVGLTQCAAVNYITDISPTRIRGALLCCYPLMVSLVSQQRSD